ncbi:MAG: hypothetical protein U0893_17805 [Chloroflexota bacterium]
MRELFVRAACFAANLVIGEPRLVVTEAEERELALARANDAYFHAFRNRCMQWVYGDDPRRPSEE